METVNSDLKKYLQRHIFPTRTVLVFPPFNGFRRFLIHKLIEDNFASSEVAAFSIGQDIGRRIVVCYRGLIRENQQQGAPTSLPQKADFTMIERERQSKQKLTPTAAVYRPPAARGVEPRQSADNPRSAESKRNRVRRPDQQMYVPRPKRASFGNEQPRSRSRSSSRTSLENDSCEKRMKSPPHKSEESRLSGPNDSVTNISSEACDELPEQLPFSIEMCKTDTILPSCSNTSVPGGNMADVSSPNEESRPRENLISNDLIQTCPPVSSDVVKDKDSMTILSPENETETSNLSMRVLQYASSVSEYVKSKFGGEVQMEDSTKNNKNDEIENIVTQTECKDDSTENEENVTLKKEVKAVEKTEAMETISISSDSRDRNSSSVTTSSSDSRSSDSSDSEVKRKHCRRKSDDKMEIDHSINTEKKKDCEMERNTSLDHNHKNRRIFPSVPVSDVLIISDSSSSNDNLITTSNISKEPEFKKDTTNGKVKKSPVKKEKSERVASKSKSVDPGEHDWETLYDDSGECLVPDLMEELTNSVGRVRVTSVDSDYRPYQSIEERTNDGECVIEIYDFPAEFKTTDLFNIFAAYRSKNFQIKWVDDTHALGVFPSPLMADEVLACTLPFVKTRPLRLGTAESRSKARGLVLPVLPPCERPKTCTALARRLVSGALGLRLPTSSQEREQERQVLREAREKRRQEAKQREAAWDGTITSENCV